MRIKLFSNGKEFVTNVTKDIGEGVKEWIKVGISSLKNNDLITCTAEHPFYVLNVSSNRDNIVFEGYQDKNKQLRGSWIASKELKIGDELLLSNGENAIILSVEVEYYDESQTTYNFEVEDFHTYYVGESGILVHNNCTGSYDITFESGKHYVGKGSEARMAKSTSNISRKFSDPVVSKVWTPAANHQSAFVSEYLTMGKYNFDFGGILYNKIHSPGRLIFELWF